MSSIISVPVGTVCIECIIGGSIATGASFQINNANIDSDKAVTVDGVLIIFNTSNVFHPSVTTNVRCTGGSSTIVILDGMYNYQQHSSTLHLLNCGKLSLLHMILCIIAVYVPPIINGELNDGTMTDGVLAGGVLTINEHDDLVLNCDSSNSNNAPPVRWIGLDGEQVSDDRELEIDDILRSAAGVYTCETLPNNPDNATSNTVQVIVQCKLCRHLVCVPSHHHKVRNFHILLRMVIPQKQICIHTH